MAALFPCITAKLNGNELEKRLHERAKEHINGGMEEKAAYRKAAKDLQEDALNQIHDIYNQIGLTGYEEPSTPRVSENIKNKFSQLKSKQDASTQSAAKPDQEGVQPGSKSEYARTEQTRSEGAPTGPEGSDSSKRGEGGKEEVTPLKERLEKVRKDLREKAAEEERSIKVAHERAVQLLRKREPNSPEPAPEEPKIIVPTEDELKTGEQVSSIKDAADRLTDGERIFNVPEKTEEPIKEITTPEELKEIPPEQLIAIKPKEEPVVPIVSDNKVERKNQYDTWKDSKPIGGDEMVKVYRTVKKGSNANEIKPGDWVSANMDYIKGYGDKTDKIIEGELPAKHLVDAQTGEMPNDTLIYIPETFEPKTESKPITNKEVPIVSDKQTKELPEPEAKVVQRKIRDEKLKKDIDAALDDLFGSKDITLTSGGLDPEKVEKAVKVIGLYMKAGVYKFKDIIEDVYAKYGAKAEELFRALKTAYLDYFGSEATNEEAAKMDLNLREYTFENIVKNIKEEPKPKPDGPRDFIDSIKEKIGNKEKLNIISIRKLAAEAGIGHLKDTELQEMTELGIVEMAKDIAKSDKSKEEKYDDIVDLYNSQPTISMRSSERIDKQQYSTPIPMAYLMGQYINDGHPQTVLEPTAGNGMLAFNIPSDKVIANEIDPVRLQMLGEQGFKMVSGNDATRPFPHNVDGVIMNPPFGKAEAKDFDGVPIRGLDEQIIANTLNSLDENGRGAIIMGGHNEYDEKGRLAKDRIFLNYLHNRYNVDDVINVDGSLYAKQGTSFPVRIILIDGKKEVKEGYAPLEDKEANKPVTNWEELQKRFEGIKNEKAKKDIENLFDKSKKIKDGNITEERPGGIQSGVDAERDNGDVIHGGSAEEGKDTEQGTGTSIPSEQDRLLDTTKQESEGKTISDDRGLADDLSGAISDREREFDAANNGDRALDEGTEGISGEPIQEAANKPGGGTSKLPGGDIVPISDRTLNILDEKAKYQPKSQGKSVDTVMPGQMAQETYHTLDAIEKIYGNIDNFVSKELGYKDNDKLFKALSAEQVDAVAIAIHQLKSGQGMIVGDMTGVGKGRIAAAIVRYAVKNGYKPIFLTEKPNLFSDLHRDMVAIGSDDLTPFIVNDKNAANNPDITNEKGEVVHRSFGGSQKKDILYSDRIPNNYDYTVATYSQFRKSMDKPSIKRDFFLRNAQDNILIMDESHNASGESNSGAIFQDLLPNTKGVVFLSATFAKRPDNMPVYAMKTAMSDANMSKEELVAAIQRGGVALQEVVAANLVQSGQMIRRERDFKGVKIHYNVLDEHKESHTATANAFTSVVRDVIDFEKRHIIPLLDDIDSDMAAQQGTAVKTPGTRSAGISNVPFASKTFNLINQMLFAIKAEEIAKAAIQAHKEGYKPVIGFLSTMESFLNSLGVTVGEKLDKADFAMVLKKALDGTMKYTIRDGAGNNIPATLSLSELSPEARTQYDKILKTIRGITSGISISPIDVMTKVLQDAGLRVGEITGRKLYLEIQPDGSSIVKERKERNINKIARGFNNGDEGTDPPIDTVLLNASGATGLSMHSSREFKDQRPRKMISGQLELDINKEVQKRGRVDRTNQVHRAAYEYIVSAIPAEQRLLMMFKQKLKSLDANTTSSQKSKNQLDIEDFLNKYGDEVVTQYLKENTDFNEKIQDPFDFARMDDHDLADVKKVDNAASKVTGRVAILPTNEQEAFYKDIIDAYTSHMNYLKDNNENDLEVKMLPLNATTIGSQEVISGRGTNSPFGMPSTREKVEVDVLTKPMKKAEIDHEVEKSLGGKTPKETKDAILKELDTYSTEFTAKKIQKIEDAYTKEIIPETLARLKAKLVKSGVDSKEIENSLDEAKENLLIAKENKIQRETTKYDNVFSSVEHNIKTFTAGDVYSVPMSTRVDTNTFFSKGIFMGLHIKEGATNKYTPSNIVMRFAVNDSRRIVSVPLSKIDYINAIIANSRYIDNKQDIKDNWDSKISNKTRATRYIITGNLLQAYGTNDGQLVSYTTDTGAIRKGMLLPDSYDAGKQKFRTTISQALTDNDFNGQSRRRITSTDGDVSLDINRGDFTLIVPLSKQRGGKYFLEPKIRDLVVGNDFQQYGGRMEADVNADNIRPLLAQLDSMGVTVENDIDNKNKNYQVKTPENDEVSQMKEVVRDLINEGTTSLKQIEAVAQKELGQNMSTAEKAKLSKLVEDAYNEATKEVKIESGAKNELTTSLAKRINSFVDTIFGKSKDSEGHVELRSLPDDVLGFTDTKTGKIVLNSKEINPNTPVHEAGTIWTEWAKENDTQLYNRGIELINKSDYLTKVKAHEFYQTEAAKLPEEEREAYFQHEALSTAIGDKGAQFITEAKRNSFIEWAKNLWDKIGKELGFKDVTAEELQNMTLDEFAKRAAADILKGEPQRTIEPKLKIDADETAAADESGFTSIRKEKLKEEISGAKTLIERRQPKTWSEVYNNALTHVQEMYPKESLYGAMKNRVNYFADKVDKKQLYNPTSEDIAVFNVFRAKTGQLINDIEGMESDDPSERNRAIFQYDSLEQDLFNVARVVNPEGEAGRAFGMHQSEVKFDPDYGLKVRRMSLLRAKGGNPLSEEDMAWTEQKWSEQKELMRQEQEIKERGMKDEFTQKLADLEAQFKDQTVKPDRTTKEKTLKQSGKEFADKIRKLKTTGTQVDFTFGTWNLAVEGIAKLVEGGATLAEAIKQLIDDNEVGFKTEKDRQHFEDILVDGLNRPDKKEALDLIRDYAEENGLSDVTKEMVGKGLITHYVNSHIGEIEQKDILNVAYEDLKPELPDLTKKKLIEAYLKEGDYKQDTKEILEGGLEEQKKQLRSIAKLEEDIADLNDFKGIRQRSFPTERERSEYEQELLDEKAEIIKEQKERRNQIIADNKAIENEAQRQLQKVGELTEKRDKLLAGIRDKKAKNPEKIDTPEIEDLKEQVKEANKNLREAEKETNRLKRESQKKKDKLAELDANIKRAEAGQELIKTYRKKPERNIDAEIAAKQKELKKAVQDYSTEEQVQAKLLKQAKENSANKIKEYERKLAEGEYEAPTKPTLTKTDSELLKLRKKESEIEEQFRKKQRELREANKGSIEKLADFARSIYVAFLIGSFKTLSKVGSLAVLRPLSETFTKATLGKIYKTLFPGIGGAALKAGEGSSWREIKKGFEAYFMQKGPSGIEAMSARSEAAYQKADAEYNSYKKDIEALKSANPNIKLPLMEKKLKALEKERKERLLGTMGNLIYQFIGGSSTKDFMTALIHRTNEIERQFGRVEGETLPEPDPSTFKNFAFSELDHINYAFGFVGRSHSALKTFSGRFSFAAGFMARLEAAVNDNVPLSADKVLEIADESYLDWERGKYQQDNLVTRWWNRILSNMDKHNDVVSKFGATALRFDVAITRVPVNILHEAVMEYTLGAARAAILGTKAVKTAKQELAEQGILKGSEGFKEALRQQISQMNPEEAATIVRAFRKGGVGIGMYALSATLLAVHFGIFPHLGQKKKKDEDKLGPTELNPGQVMVGDNKYGEIMSSVIEHIPALWPTFMGLGLVQAYHDEIKKGRTTTQAAASSLYTHLKIVEGSIPQTKIIAGAQEDVVNTMKKRLTDSGVIDKPIPQGYVKSDLSDPSFKYVTDKGVNLPRYIPTNIEVPHSTKKLSELSEGEITQFGNERKIYLKMEIDHLIRAGHAYVSKEGKAAAKISPDHHIRKKLDELSTEQLQEIISSLGGQATEQAKKKLLLHAVH